MIACTIFFVSPPGSQSSCGKATVETNSFALTVRMSYMPWMTSHRLGRHSGGLIDLASSPTGSWPWKEVFSAGTRHSAGCGIQRVTLVTSGHVLSTQRGDEYMVQHGSTSHSHVKMVFRVFFL